MVRIFVSAAEPSGDRLGGALLEALARRVDVAAVGMGGPHLTAAGLEAWRDAGEHAVLGFVEVVALLPRLFALVGDLARRATAARPDVAVLIDAPDFHLRLARRLRRAGVPVVLLVPPAVWASRPGRVRRFVAAVDRVLVLFPFEVACWSEAVACTWVGHPMVDAIPAPRRPTAEDAPIALLPGSRPGEVARHLPVLAAAARRLRARGVAARFVVPLGTPDLAARIESGLADLPVELVSGPDALAAAVGRARGALVASGTATLETALLGCPQVALYRLHPVTYAVARRLMTVEHWALPNLLMDARVVPERIQSAATGPGLADALEAELARGPQPALDLATAVRSRLGPPGAADRAATAVLDVARADHRDRA